MVRGGGGEPHNSSVEDGMTRDIFVHLASIIEAIRLYYGCWTKTPEVNEPRSTSHTHT